MNTPTIRDLKLNTGDIIKFDRQDYKIMFRKDLSYIPPMGFALQRFQKEITYSIVSTEIVDFEAINKTQEIKFKGIVQPLKPSQLMLKPEEQRSWDWLQIHVICSDGMMEYHVIEMYGEV
jgi:hypothetical protein